jgi:cullin 1
MQRRHSKVVGAILRLIKSQRNGEVIDQTLVKHVVESFVSMGIDDVDTSKACLDVYEEHFQRPFLEETEIFYKAESEAFLAEHSVSDYLKKAERRIKEEEDRVDRYLHSSTKDALVSACDEVLIRQHATVLLENFNRLLEADKEQDVKRLYALMSRIPEGLEPMRKTFQEHVKTAGHAVIAKLVGENEDSGDGVEAKDYVDTLLQIYQKNHDRVTRCFKGEAGFFASLDKACRQFMNENAVTRKSHRTAELLAKHFDLLLRKNSKVAQEVDMDASCTRAVSVFASLPLS